MKALVFAAGLGTRLRPFTLEHPKALVPMAGVPMLQRVIEKLKQAGITDITVNVHHFADQIIDFLDRNGGFGTDIKISDERDLLLDTGGGILKARALLGEDEPFLVHNADIFTDFPLQEMIERHASTGADITLLADARNTSRYIIFSPEGKMTGWTNITTGQVLPEGFKPDPGSLQLAFGGVHILSPSVFPVLEKHSGERAFPIMPFYISECRTLDIRAYTPSAPYRWHDIGKPESLRAAELSMSE